MQTKLSVNLNKVALIRNSRGENLPDLIKVAKDCESFGAQGITIHPRPDQRHAKYTDVRDLKNTVTTELNIEGYPNEKFLEVVEIYRPTQVTLVPDPPGALTSTGGWDTRANKGQLQQICGRLKEKGMRVSLFIDPKIEDVSGAKEVGADRVELYTGQYAREYAVNREAAVEAHIRCGEVAMEQQVGLNAGHDLNLDNLAYYAQQVPGLLEVSIGHALICDALYFGLENVIQMYLQRLNR